MLETESGHAMGRDRVVRQMDEIAIRGHRKSVDRRGGRMTQPAPQAKLCKSCHARWMEDLAGKAALVVEAGLNQHHAVAELLDRGRRRRACHAASADNDVDVSHVG